MASRSSGTSSRSRKSVAVAPPPIIRLPDETHNDDRTHSDDVAHGSRAADRGVDEAPGNVAITKSKLQQREIPSFSESREARIAESAYWRAERRGFQSGHELEDWLHAEKEVDGDGSSK